jgi:protein dithiol oxidoreductase (disulfide-forming)
MQLNSKELKMAGRISKQILLFVLLVPLALTALAQPEKYVAGTHYTVLNAPVKTNNPEKIEVIEAFWYGCAHCFRFEPLVENWHANAPDDVDFILLPAVWDPLMKVHAQAFYAAEAIGALDKLHTPIFNAINMERNRLQNEKQLTELVTKHGVSESEFLTAFNSFAVRTKVNQVDRKMKDYQIQSTPNMIVNGKYLVVNNQAVQSQQDMLDVVDFLVDRERRAR